MLKGVGEAKLKNMDLPFYRPFAEYKGIINFYCIYGSTVYFLV